MAADTTTGLISKWLLREAANSNALDSVGANTLLQTSGTIDTLLGPDGVNTGRLLAAADTEYFELTPNGTLQSGDIDFALTGWVYFTTLPSNSIVVRNGWDGAGSANREFIWWFPSSTSMRLTVGVGAGAVDHQLTVSVVTGRWYFVYVAHRAGSNLVEAEISLDIPLSSAHATGVNAGVGPFTLGASPTQALYFPGGLADVRYYKNRVLTKEDRHAIYGEAYGVRTLYVDPNAAGANDGSSFTDAWTSLASAAASTGIRPDDQLLLNASSAAPLVGGQHFNNLWGIDLICRSGDDGAYNATNGRLFSTATGPTAGVFTATGITEPTHVVWNWRADPTGATTGWVNDAQDVALLNKHSVAERDRTPKLGFLVRNTGTPTTPGEGEWGWTSTAGGSLFLNPPGAPDQATVRTSARYCLPGSHGIGLLGCGKATFAGPAYFDLYPSITNSEYGLFANGQDMVVSDVTVNAGGWHGMGSAGVSPINGPRNTFRRIVAIGTTGDEATSGSSNGLVFYQPNTATEFGGHVAENYVFIGAPRFLNSGVPATTNWLPQPVIVHSDAPVTTMSAIISRGLAIDKTDQLEAFHGITNNAVGISSLSEGTVSNPFTVTGYPLQFRDFDHKGRFVPSPVGKASYLRGSFDRSGCGRSALAAVTGSAGTAEVCIQNAVLLLGLHSLAFFESFDAPDALLLDGCKILIESDVAKSCLVHYLAAATGTNRIRITNCQIDSADPTKTHGIIRGNATAYAGNFDDVLAGGNVFGTSIVPAYNFDGSASRDITWWQANVEGGSTDVQRDLGWGATGPEKVAYLRGLIRQGGGANQHMGLRLGVGL